MIPKRIRKLLTGRIPLSRILLELDQLFAKVMGRRSHSRLYFEHVYTDADPWKYQTSSYELTKYERKLNNLPCDRYQKALEIGCSIGVFTEKLGERVDHLDAVDISKRAINRAQTRCQHQPHVRFMRGDIAKLSLSGGYNLILASEVLYYQWEPLKDRIVIRDKLQSLLAPEGDLLIVLSQSGMEQDWETVFTENGKLRLFKTEQHHSPEGSYRISILRQNHEA
jgi:trans-aconitate methyltransferase